MVSFAALRWLADQNAALVMLDRDGTVLVTTGPIAASDARLRRAQACCTEQSGAAVMIVRELIDRKLGGQEDVARNRLREIAAADAIAGFRVQLDTAETLAAIRLLEAQGSQAYWSAWRNITTEFPRSDLARIPDHWRSFGSRQSPLTGSPRHAVTPANAILNYLYALLESETRLATAALGLDPGLGLLHFDYRSRDSLACDLMEPIRPKVDAYLFDWITRSPLKREWFFEQRDGNCRLMASIAARLSETAMTWRREVAPVVEWFAETISATAPNSARYRGPGTRLTQRRWREAAGYAPKSVGATPKPQTACGICGKPISFRRKYCPECTRTVAAEQMAKVQTAGSAAARNPESGRKRGETQRRQNVARRAWDPSQLPEWLTIETYTEKIQPRLARLTRAAIAAALRVSVKYAGDVRYGNAVPHQRHWVKLANLAGIG
jgi:CRISPR-associated endonuclease Cas1